MNVSQPSSLRLLLFEYPWSRGVESYDHEPPQPRIELGSRGWRLKLPTRPGPAQELLCFSRVLAPALNPSNHTRSPKHSPVPKMPTMITDGLATAFRSKRLIFRALEDNEADRDFLFTQIENDPVSTALANPAMVVPRSSKSAQALVSELAKSTLAVIVCLTPEAAVPVPVAAPDTAAGPALTDTGEQQLQVPEQPDVPAQDAALHSTPAPHPTSTSTPTPTPTPTPPSALTPIGFMFLGWGGTPPDRAQHRCTELGLQLAAAFQGKGYGAEAVDWGVDWAFRFGGLHRVTIKTVGYNTRAQHLYTRLGFVEEGRSREAHWHDRKWYDVVSYGMLEGEWAKLRGLEE